MLWISGLVQDKQNKSTTTEDDPFDVNEVIDNDRVIEEGDIDESEDDDSEDLAIDTETEVEEPSNSRYKVFNHLYAAKDVSNAPLFLVGGKRQNGTRQPKVLCNATERLQGQARIEFLQEEQEFIRNSSFLLQ